MGTFFMDTLCKYKFESWRLYTGWSRENTIGDNRFFCQ